MMLMTRFKMFGYWILSIAFLLAMFIRFPLSLGLFPICFLGAWLANRRSNKLAKEIKSAMEMDSRKRDQKRTDLFSER